MTTSFQSFLQRIVLATGFLASLFSGPQVIAGSIGFSVDFTGDELSITNAGGETGYQFSLWTLNPSEQWQQVTILSGNADYLAPGKSLKGRRQSPAKTNGLGRADPLLVTLFDQAGSRIVQLAWRKTPVSAPYSLPTQRRDRWLDVSAGNARAAKIVASYGITVPYEGIKRLAQGISTAETPPAPMHQVWATGPTMTLDTGAGQGGAWLVHEMATGDLQVQIVGDGTERGREQVPAWLNWVRRRLMAMSVDLAVAGFVLLLGGAWLAPFLTSTGRNKGKKRGLR